MSSKNTRTTSTASRNTSATQSRGSSHGQAAHGVNSGPGSNSTPKQSSTGSGGQSQQGNGARQPPARTGRSNNRSSDSSSGGSPNRGNQRGAKTTTPPPPEPAEYQRLYALIFRGFPHDSYNKRHTGLFIEHVNNVDGIWRLNSIDIEGAARRWRVRESVGRDPEHSDLLVAKIKIRDLYVGRGAPARADRRLRDSIYNARIDNNDEEWNCQAWLTGALQRLVVAGLITEAEKRRVLDAVDDVVLAAPSQPIVLH